MCVLRGNLRRDDAITIATPFPFYRTELRHRFQKNAQFVAHRRRRRLQGGFDENQEKMESLQQVRSERTIWIGHCVDVLITRFQVVRRIRVLLIAG